MPPPLPVEWFPLIVLLLRRHGPVLFMAPPPPEVFPVNVLPLTVSEPSLRIPPPLSLSRIIGNRAVGNRERARIENTCALIDAREMAVGDGQAGDGDGLSAVHG